MAVNSRTDGHPLLCGRLVEDLFDDLEAGRTDAHSAGCEHCATARRSLHQLAQATRLLVDDPAVPPPRLLERVMSAVRADLGRGAVLPLPAVLGPADVAERAVAVVLRYAADSVAGVWARSCRIDPEPDRPGAAWIRMTLSLRYGTGPAEPLLAEVRRRVSTALSGQVGLRAHTIDLELVDIWPWSPGDRGHE